jgi:hypothetical protein
VELLRDPALGTQVHPHFGLVEHIVATLEALQGRGLTLPHHEPAGIAGETVVVGDGDFAQVLVAAPVSGPQRLLKPGALAPRPELLAEDLPLRGLGQLEEEIRLLGQDDRGDVVCEPLSIFLGQCLEALGALGRRQLRHRRGGHRSAQRKECGNDEERGCSRLHRTVDLTPRSRYGRSLRKVLRAQAFRGDNLENSENLKA